MAYNVKTVPLDAEAEQIVRNAVQFYKLRREKMDDPGGPTTVRDFVSQACLRLAVWLQTRDNEGMPFEHCERLPKGRGKK